MPLTQYTVKSSLFKLTLKSVEGSPLTRHIAADYLEQADDFLIFTQDTAIVALVRTEAVLLIEIEPNPPLH